MNEATPLVRGPPGTFWIRLFAYLSAFAEGYGIGVFAGVVVRVKEVFDLSAWEVGVLSGALYFAMAAGALCSGPLADGFGRVPTLAVVHAVLLGAFVLSAAAPGFATLVAARALLGGGIGCGLAVVSTYISETSPAKSRGAAAAGVALGLNLGILAGFVASWLLVGIPSDWRVMLGLGTFVPLSVLVLAVGGCFPESPRYFLVRGDTAGARAALRRLADEEEADETLQMWIGSPHRVSVAGVFGTRQRRRMACAGLGCGLMHQLSGIGIVTNLGAAIIAGAGFGEKEAVRTIAISGLGMVLGSLPTLLLIDQVGRRPLLFISAVVMSAGSACIAAGFYWHLPLRFIEFAFALFIVGFSFGFGPVVYVYIAEVFETPVRATGTSLAIFAGRATTGVLLTVVPLVVHTPSNTPWVFVALAAVNLLFVGVVYKFCPETKEWKLEELRTLFESLPGSLVNTPVIGRSLAPSPLMGRSLRGSLAPTPARRSAAPTPGSMSPDPPELPARSGGRRNLFVE